MSTSPTTPDLPRSLRLVLLSSVPIALGVLVASLAGVLSERTYAAESASWAAQGAGQDLANLVIVPVLLVLAWRAAKGSAAAYLGWLGCVAYTSYSYLLYAGYVHFSGWFLVYVATWGLATYALIAGLALLDPGRVREAFAPATPVRGVGATLVGLGTMFALLWLSEIVPPALDGTVPQTVQEAGLITNPVWILDLGLVLPAMIAAGLLLRRRRPLGFILAGPLLAFGVAMGAAIVAMQAMLWVRDEPMTLTPVVMISIVVAVEAVALWHLLRGLTAAGGVTGLLRPGSREVAVATGTTKASQRVEAGAAR